MIQTQQVLQTRYRLLQHLKQTAGRQTWLAEDLAHQPPRNVIIKLLAFADPINWDTLKLFKREAKILRHLDYPYIPQYLDSFSIEDRLLWFGLVQEFIPGTSLKKLLEQGKRFSEKNIYHLATEVLQTLIYLHELSPPVLHRDIKPSNLIWGDDGHLHLIDFDTVQDKAKVEGATFTVVGTYGYAPMEQFGGRTVPSSDLYALGATLIHLLTGVPPADLPQHNLRIQFADKTSLRSGLVRWIGKMTEPDIAYRFETARAALESLQLTRQDLESSLTAPPVTTTEQTNALSTMTANPVTAIAQRPATSPIELHQSPKALEIRIPGDPSPNVGTIVGLCCLMATIPFLIDATVFVILPLFFSGLFFYNGINRGSTSIVKFTRRRFTRYKEMQVFSRPHRWLLDKAPTSMIRMVAHYHLVPRRENAVETDKEQVVAIKTEHQTYYLGESIITGEKLSHEECMWLAQTIRAWLGLGRQFEELQ